MYVRACHDYISELIKAYGTKKRKKKKIIKLKN